MNDNPNKGRRKPPNIVLLALLLIPCIPLLVPVIVLGGIAELVCFVLARGFKIADLTAQDILPIHLEVFAFSYPISLLCAVSLAGIHAYVVWFFFIPFLLILLLQTFFVYAPEAEHRWLYVFKIPFAMMMCVPFLLLIHYGKH